MSKKNFISGAMDLLHELLVGMLKSNYQTRVSKSREILLEHKDYQDSPDERKRKIYTEASQFHAQRGDVYKSILYNCTYYNFHISTKEISLYKNRYSAYEPNGLCGCG